MDPRESGGNRRACLERSVLVLESLIRLFSSSLIDRLKSFCPAFAGSLAKAARFRLFNCAIIQGRRVSNNVLDN